MKRTFRKFILLLICALVLYGVYHAYTTKNEKATEADSMIGELWLMLGNTAELSDAELRAKILKIAEDYHTDLTDAQVQQLFDLSRSLEKLDPEKISQKADDLKNLLKKLAGAKDQIGGLIESAQQLIESISGAADKLDGILNK